MIGRGAGGIGLTSSDVQTDVTYVGLADGTKAEVLDWFDDHSRFCLGMVAHHRVGVHQTLKQWLTARPPAADIAELQALLDEFRDTYNHHRPHRSLARTTPADAYTRLPKTGPATSPTTEHRIRHDRVDTTGKVTLRHNSRLYKIGIGRAHARTPILMLIDGLDIRIINTQTGELLRHLELDPTRTYQPIPK